MSSENLLLMQYLACTRLHTQRVIPVTGDSNFFGLKRKPESGPKDPDESRSPRWETRTPDDGVVFTLSLQHTWITDTTCFRVGLLKLGARRLRHRFGVSEQRLQRPKLLQGMQAHRCCDEMSSSLCESSVHSMIRVPVKSGCRSSMVRRMMAAAPASPSWPQRQRWEQNAVTHLKSTWSSWQDA